MLSLSLQHAFSKWKNAKSPYLTDIIILFFIFIPIYLLLLGNRPFATPDEARYVEIPREMLLNHDWITPRLNGIKYFEKPPLLYWIQAFIQKHCGISEWIMRFPIVCFGLMGIISTYVFGHRFFSRTIGLKASLILGTTVLWFSLSRLIILDMAVSVCITIALFSFYTAMHETGIRRRMHLTLFTIMCGLGVLTKGLMALVVVGSVICLWCAITKQWKRLLPLYLPSNILLLSCITAPWHILAALANPEFLHKYFIVEHYLRYTTTIHMRYQPVWFFIPILLLGYLPWTGYLLSAIATLVKNLKTRTHYDKHILFLCIWAAFVFIFFSYSHSKLIPYILPLFPPLALVIAHFMQNINAREFGHTPTAYLAGSVSLCLFSLPYFADIIKIEEIHQEKNGILKWILYVAIILLIMAISNLKTWKIKRHFQFALNCTLSLALLFCIIMGTPYAQKTSAKSLIEYAITHKSPSDRIVSFETYFQDLPVYSHEKILVVNYLGELEFGTTVEDTSSWMMNHYEFSKQLDARTNTYWIFLKEDKIPSLYQHYPDIQFDVIRCDHNICLVCNAVTTAAQNKETQ